MNLYIISSPFQLVCAMESLLQSKKKSIFWIYLGIPGKGNDLMLKLADEYLKNENVFYSIKTNPIILLINKIKFLKKINKTYKIENLFIGNLSEFSEKLCAVNIKCKKLWSLDDGAKTLVLKEFYTDKNKKIDCFGEKKMNSLIKYLILKCFFLKASKEIDINWFTIFDFKPKNKGVLHVHELLNFKKQINFNGTFSSNNKNVVYFIGSNLINAGVISKAEDYLKSLHKIKSCYPEKKIIYMPHRFESLEVIDKIREFGFEIKELDHIIEIAFLEEEIYPYTIASFYSTALYSMSKLFPKANVDFFQIDKNYISSKFTNHVKTVEKEYKTFFGTKNK